MASLRGLVGRLRGERVDAVAREVAELRELALAINHQSMRHGHQLDSIDRSVAELSSAVAELVAAMETQRAVLLELNHDIRSGADDALPLFLGYAERLRLDTDTAIGAVQVIERQLAQIEALVAARDAPDPG